MCDEKGQIVDGDQILALIARSWHKQGLLKGGGVVGTVMSNLGFERYLKSINLDLKRMPVGDRYVMDHMRTNGYNVGGEQSGHVILNDYSTTGDGLLAALQVLAVICQAEGEASDVCRIFKPVPQLLVNVRYQPTSTISLESHAMQEAIHAAEKKMGGGGRILVRKSGTEPLIRIMAEGDDETLVKTVVQELREFVEGLDKQSTQKARA
jgi:phosphoglucosamine mutase